MTGFTKLWSEILSSSIWNEDDKVRIVWITMLAAMGPDYMVRASVGGLAHMARVSKEACEHALTVLTSPDPDSRSQDNEGRRVQKVDGGFFILNGGKYREARSLDERKVYMANYMKEYRKRQNERKLERKQRKQNVNASKPPLAQAEAEADSTKPPIVPQGGLDVEIPELLRTKEFLDAWENWLTYRKEKRKPVSTMAAKQQLQNCLEWGVVPAIQSIKDSIANDYQGLFPTKLSSRSVPATTKSQMLIDAIA